MTCPSMSLSRLTPYPRHTIPDLVHLTISRLPCGQDHGFSKSVRKHYVDSERSPIKLVRSWRGSQSPTTKRPPGAVQRTTRSMTRSSSPRACGDSAATRSTYAVPHRRLPLSSEWLNHIDCFAVTSAKLACGPDCGCSPAGLFDRRSSRGARG